MQPILLQHSQEEDYAICCGTRRRVSKRVPTSTLPGYEMQMRLYRLYYIIVTALTPCFQVDDCTRLGTTYTTTTGEKFNISCSMDFPLNDIALTYASNVSDCANQCALYNQNSPAVPCIGAALDYQATGPLGVLGKGYQCWLKWKVGTPKTTSNVDAVRLIGPVPVALLS